MSDDSRGAPEHVHDWKYGPNDQRCACGVTERYPFAPPEPPEPRTDAEPATVVIGRWRYQLSKGRFRDGEAFPVMIRWDDAPDGDHRATPIGPAEENAVEEVARLRAESRATSSAAAALDVEREVAEWREWAGKIKATQQMIAEPLLALFDHIKDTLSQEERGALSAAIFWPRPPDPDEWETNKERWTALADIRDPAAPLPSPSLRGETDLKAELVRLLAIYRPLVDHDGRVNWDVLAAFLASALPLAAQGETALPTPLHLQMALDRIDGVRPGYWDRRKSDMPLLTNAGLAIAIREELSALAAPVSTAAGEPEST